MKLNQLQPKQGAVTDRTRVGRGMGSGKGKTSGSGHKGQKARKGVAINGFEGGQMPLFQRLPKRGFNNIFAKDIRTVSTGRLQLAVDKGQIDATKPVDEDLLVSSGVINAKGDAVKLLNKGELKAKITLKVSKASKGAKEAVEKAGGSVELAA